MARVGESRKRVLAIVIAGFGFLVVSQSNFTADAAPSKCRKAGAVRTIKGKRWICRSGTWRLVRSTPKTNPSASTGAVISGTGARSSSLDLCKLKDARVLPDGSRPMLATDYEFPYKVGVDYGYMQTDRSQGIVYGNPHLVPGLPLRDGMFPALGVARIAVIAVDYLDAAATGNELEIARKAAEEASSWFADQSAGRLRVEYRFGDRIFRIQKNSESYGLYRSEGNSAPNLARDVIAVADPHFDFTGIDALWVINPKSVGSVPIPGYSLGSIPEDFNFPGNPGDPRGQTSVMSNEGSISRWTGNGVYQYREDNNFWTFFVHETMHYIGLQDYRHRTQRVQEDGTKTNFDDPSKNLPFRGFEIMSDQDGGSRSLNSFNRLLLGWWDSTQIHCQALGKGEAVSLTLDALAGDGSRKKSLMIQLDEYRVLVVESRWAVGYDRWLGENAVGVPDGDTVIRKYLSDLGPSGILVYIHDSRAHQHFSPAHIQIPNDGRYRKVGLVTCLTCESWADRNDPNQTWDPNDMRGPQVVVGFDPLLRVGQSLTVGDYTIKNVESIGGGDKVEVSRSK